jgi:hypothetical protein
MFVTRFRARLPTPAAGPVNESLSAGQRVNRGIEDCPPMSAPTHPQRASINSAADQRGVAAKTCRRHAAPGAADRRVRQGAKSTAYSGVTLVAAMSTTICRIGRNPAMQCTPSVVLPTAHRRCTDHRPPPDTLSTPRAPPSGRRRPHNPQRPRGADATPIEWGWTTLADLARPPSKEDSIPNDSLISNALEILSIQNKYEML